MYTLLIVEDEPNIRDSLAECLPWNQWGFSVLGTADNGRMALEKMRIAMPDVILTDIRMPVMDGIALLKAVHNTHPHVPVIILSGHDDFEYARQALSLGAYAYVLKLEIRSRMEQLMEQIRKDITERQRDRAKRKRELTTFLRQIIIQTILGHNPKAQPGFDEAVLNGMQYFILVIHIESEQYPLASPFTGSVMMQLEQYLENRLSVVPCQRLLACVREDELVLFFIRRENPPQDCGALSAQLHDVWSDLTRQSFAADYRFVMASGSQFYPYEKLYEAYHLVRSRSLLYSPVNQCLLVETTQAESSTSMDILRATGPIERNLIDAMQLCDDQSVLTKLDLWLQHWNNGAVIDVITFRQHCTWLYLALVQVLGNASLSDGAADFKALSDVSSVPALSYWLRVHVAILLENRSDASGNMPARIRKVKRYLYDHCMERISLAEIADKLHMNASYLSTSFKNETGKSFADFYNELRMKKAYELFQNGYTVTRVSEMMCYADTKSFRRMFRLHMGINPGTIIRQGEKNPES